MYFWERFLRRREESPAAEDHRMVGLNSDVAELGRYFGKRKARRLKQLAARQFPRTIDDMMVVAGAASGAGGGFAMDAGLQQTGAVRSRIELDNVVLERLEDYFIGWQSMAILKQNWLIDRACTIPVEDAVAPGWQLSFIDSASADEKITKEGQKEQAARLQEMENSAREWGIAELCRKAEVLKKTFGYCLVVPIIEGADMSKPFNLDAVRPGSYKGLRTIEPMWIMPQFDEDGRDPLSPNFYNPTWYAVAGSSGKRIHRSWCVKLVNSPVADVLKPTYFFGGVSLTQQIFRRVYAAETVANEAPNLAMTKRLVCVEGSVENAIANPDLAEERMRAAIEWRDNYGILLVDNDSRVTQLETGLTDFDQLIMTQYQLVASIAQMPVTKLLKVQLKGFDNTGEYETNDYYQSLRTIQANDYTPIIDLHNMLFGKSKYGERMGLMVRWNELQTPTPKENAEMQVLKAQKDVALVNAGIVSPGEARERMRNDEYSEYTELPDEREIDEWGDLDDPPENGGEPQSGGRLTQAVNNGNGGLGAGGRGMRKMIETSAYTAGKGA